MCVSRWQLSLPLWTPPNICAEGYIFGLSCDFPQRHLHLDQLVLKIMSQETFPEGLGLCTQKQSMSLMWNSRSILSILKLIDWQFGQSTFTFRTNIQTSLYTGSFYTGYCSQTALWRRRARGVTVSAPQFMILSPWLSWTQQKGILSFHWSQKAAFRPPLRFKLCRFCCLLILGIQNLFEIGSGVQVGGLWYSIGSPHMWFSGYDCLHHKTNYIRFLHINFHSTLS